MSSEKPALIHVIAGVNGAGKSSIQGAAILENPARAHYYNPDEAARELMTADPGLTQSEANSFAWTNGVELLKLAIKENLDFSFETTLGGNTIPQLLVVAAGQGFRLVIWYVGLDSPELHIARVRKRVARGGHDIPEDNIRRRYESSRVNLINLIPHLTRLRVFDNSFEADPEEGQAPKPVLVLRMESGRIFAPSDLTKTPTWAKSIVAAAIKHERG